MRSNVRRLVILSIYNGKGITQEEIDDNPGTLEAVQSGEENNGVLGYIDLEYCKSKGYTYTMEKCLTVARSGSAGFVAYHGDGCVVGDSAKILILKDKNNRTEYVESKLIVDFGIYRNVMDDITQEVLSNVVYMDKVVQNIK